MKSEKLQVITRAEAQRLTDKVVKQWKSMETAWFDLGKQIDECFHRGVPAALGMNAKQWLEKCIPGSVSRAFRALRAARALSAVPEKQVRQITEGNAVELARLPETKRKSKEWVAKAIEQPNEQFRGQVEVALGRRPKEKQEFVTLKIDLPKPIYDSVEEAVKKVARILGMDIDVAPGLRIVVWEAIAAMINTAPEQTLKAEVTGDESAARG